MNSSVQNPECFTYLFGYPISHSWSPLLHNTMYQQENIPWTYQLFESTDIQAFLKLLKAPKCGGSSVTMPHKIAILDHLDELTQEGREVGACNTVFIRKDAQGNRRYIGTNTDVIGIREAFAQNAPGIYKTAAQRPGLVIGGGGAARSAVYALVKYFGCSQVYLVNRDKGEVDAVMASCQASGFGAALVHVSTAEQAAALEAPAIAVGCVPDFPPKTAAEVQARQVVEIMLQKTTAKKKEEEEEEGKKDSGKGVILEMAYHPTVWTELACLARDAGWQVVLGTEAVIWQGIEQHRLWTGRTIEQIPVQACKDVFSAALAAVPTRAATISSRL